MGNIWKSKESNESNQIEEPQDKKNKDDYKWSFLDINIEKSDSYDSKNVFSILSFNILADCHMHHLNHLVDSKFSNFTYRSERVVKILGQLSPDIIMLQEVDNFTRYYKSQISNLGYELLYKAKENLNNEGCVLGWKKDKFDLHSSSNLCFDKGHEFEKNFEYKLGNIAIHAILLHKSSKKILHVINTHLFWNPKCEHIKYLQMSIILKYIAQKVENSEIVVWGGDLNSLPQNNLIRYVLTGSSPEQNYMEGDKESNLRDMIKIYDGLQKISKSEWDNPYQYYGQAIDDKESLWPRYTNYVAYFKGTIDHIFFKKGKLRIRKLLKIPTEEEIKNKSLPNRRFPSDHLPIMTEFEII